MNATNKYNSRSLSYNTGRGGLDRYTPEKAQFLNFLIYNSELQIFKTIFKNRFKWSIPNDFKFDQDFIEEQLFYSGSLCAFKHEVYGLIIRRYSVEKSNYYNNPTVVTIDDDNMEGNRKFNVEDNNIIFLYDNLSRFVPFSIFDEYIRKIADANRTIEVYMANMKKPKIFIGDFDKKESFKAQIYKQLNNEFFIFGDEGLLKGIDQSKLTVLENNTHNSQDLLGLQMAKKTMFNELLSRVGIRTNDVMKLAQTNQHEIDKNDEMADMIIGQSLDCRKDFSEKLTELAGKEVTCEVFQDLNFNDDDFKPDSGEVEKDDNT